MGIIFTGQIPAITGPVQLEVPTATYSGISDASDASVSVNPYTNQGPGASGAGQTTQQVAESRGAEPVDDFFSSVTLLLHFEGDFSDSSNSNNSTTSQTATISSTQAKFGNSSAFFSAGGTEQITFANDSDFDFGTGDYTIEYWIFPTGPLANFQTVLDARTSTGAQTWGTSVSPTSTLTYALAGTGYETSPVALNQWHHFAVTRASGTLRLFLNGTQEVSVVNNASATGPNAFLFIGRPFNTTTEIFSFDGYLDELRITNGVARYTSNFSVPTAAFPDQ